MRSQEDWEGLAFQLDNDGIEHTLAAYDRDWFDETPLEESIRQYHDAVDQLKSEIRSIMRKHDIICEAIEE